MTNEPEGCVSCCCKCCLWEILKRRKPALYNMLLWLCCCLCMIKYSRQAKVNPSAESGNKQLDQTDIVRDQPKPDHCDD